MESLLKGLGLTIWGLVAFGLLIVFTLVGYEAALKYRPAGNPPASQDTTRASDGRKSRAASHAEFAGPPIASKNFPPVSATATDETHLLLRSAAQQQHYGLALEYGKQIVNAGRADPDDLLVIAGAYSSLNDCPNALAWVEKTTEAFQAAARAADESLQRIRTRCGAAEHAPRSLVRPDQQERVDRLLRAFKARAEADRRNLPQLEAEAENTASGDADIGLGKVYYGFGDYQHAIAAIQRGLDKGQVKHLDEAYVYLGRSLAAAGDRVEARKAFARLKEVPNIDPKVLFLWELYAETNLLRN